MIYAGLAVIFIAAIAVVIGGWMKARDSNPRCDYCNDTGIDETGQPCIYCSGDKWTNA